jgi:hypothetical protein
VSRRVVWRTTLRRTALGWTAVAALVVSACQSARREANPEADQPSREVPSNAAGASDNVQSRLLPMRDRAAAGELSAAGRAQLSEPASGTPKQAQAPAPSAALVPGPNSPRAPAGSPRALKQSDVVRFGQLKAAIERANAEVERHRPRSAQ